MDHITRDTVLKVARLAKLNLSEDELVFFQKSFADIVTYFQSLDTLVDSLPKDWRDDTAAAPMKERVDEALVPVHAAAALREAPRAAGNLFQVPKIIE